MSDDKTLEEMRSSWQATARYSVVRIRRGTRTVIGSCLTWTEAVRCRDAETLAIEQRPDYRAVMSRTIAAIELEKPNQGASRREPPRMTRSNEGSET